VPGPERDATMIRSRIASKARTTLPAPVRKALGLRAGDLIAYRIEEGRVVMTRAEGPDPFAAFAEWSGAADMDAFARF
jgi:antitoxin PrlF